MADKSGFGRLTKATLVTGVRAAPSGGFGGHDDITPEAVLIMRDRAGPKLANKNWKKLDSVEYRKAN